MLCTGNKRLVIHAMGFLVCECFYDINYKDMMTIKKHTSQMYKITVSAKCKKQNHMSV